MVLARWLDQPNSQGVTGIDYGINPGKGAPCLFVVVEVVAAALLVFDKEALDAFHHNNDYKNSPSSLASNVAAAPIITRSERSVVRLTKSISGSFM